MENYNENEQPSYEQEQTESTYGQDNNGSMFKMASIVVILGIILLGGLYMYSYMGDSGERDANQTLEEELEDLFDETGSALDEAIADVKDTVSDQLGKQGTSDAIADIEADLEASDLGEINLDDLGF